MFLSKLAIFASEVFLAPVVLDAVITPSIDVLIDFVISLASLPIPVQTPPSQPTTFSPILPFLTFAIKSPPFVVTIRLFLTPLFNKSPFTT